MSVKGYERPPIIEAIVEFRFSAPLALSGTAVANFAERLQPVMPNLQMGMEPYDAQGMVFARLRFDAVDGQSVVIVSPQSVSVHRLGVYPGWEHYRPLVACAAELARNFGDEPESASVRYNNVVDVPAGESLEEWVHLPTLGGEGIRSIHQIAVRQVTEFDDGTIETLDAHTGPSGKAGCVGIYLDLACAGPVLHSEPTMVVVDRLRDRERALFEKLVGDSARAAFVPQQS